MSSNEKTARCLALEQSYVHDVYEQLDLGGLYTEPWQKVEQFLQELEPGSIVCDIGCGSGKYLNINKTVYNIGAERSYRLSKIARENENEVIILDNLSLPFRDESLDAVISIAVIHHFASTERRVCALQELSRVLRIGGKLIISAWAMEQCHRKFESQDVLVPWHLPKQMQSCNFKISTDISDYDVLSVYNASYYSTKEEPNKNNRKKELTKKRNRFKKRKSGNSNDSDSLSSSETCYSFLRRALQKLSSGRRLGVHRPWFLENWTNCAKVNQPKKYVSDICDCYDCLENVEDLPIELRRIDDAEVQISRKLTSSTISSFIEASSVGSKSASNLKLFDNEIKLSTNDIIGDEDLNHDVYILSSTSSVNSLKKPTLVKQKKSICEDDIDELLDEPKDLLNSQIHLPEYKMLHNKYHHKGRVSVLKQRSLNEELMSTDRLKEKEQLKKNIQKQASLNEEYITQRHVFDSFKDSFFTSKGLHLIKMEFTNKIKNSTSNIEKVAGSSLKNGFVRMFQNWKNVDLVSPTISENASKDNFRNKFTCVSEKPNETTERRSSKEESSDSSKDSSLQSDTSVDSEDSFASVIYVPKSENMSPILSPGPISPRWKNNTNSNLFSSLPNSPKSKQSSCPTSPKFKQLPLTVYPLTKQMSNPKPSIEFVLCENMEGENIGKEVPPNSKRQVNKTLAQKYAVAKIPKFRKTDLNTQAGVTTFIHTTRNNSSSNSSNNTLDANTVGLINSNDKLVDCRNEGLNKIREILSKDPDFGSKSKNKSFPIVRRSSINNGKVKAIAKPLPKLLNIELFNPAIDDLDSDSSCISSPDSFSGHFPAFNCDKQSLSLPETNSMYPVKKTLLDAAADVANSLDQTVQKVIKYSPKAKRKVETNEILSILRRKYLNNELLCESFTWPEHWNEECHLHLTDFAEQISEKLLNQIDHYHQTSGEKSLSDQYIARLSEELKNLSKISSEIQKQNEYLNKLTLNDFLTYKDSADICDISKGIETNDKNEYRTTFNIQKQINNGNDCEGNSSTMLRSKFSFEDINTISRNENNFKETVDCPNLNTIMTKHKRSVGLTSKPGKKCYNNYSSLNKSTDSSDSIESVISNKISQDRNSIDDGKSHNSLDISCTSNEGSTVSLASCSDWKHLTESKEQLIQETPEKSIDSLDSNHSEKSSGGDLTFHRYYHVFREGELDSLIEKYVENLHIISSYYDHSSWCIIAEKVRVWTI